MIPNKRIKLDTNEHRNAIILSEIDIEIGLRKRLAQTFESRIAWASLLLDSLENETEYISETPFKDVALTALSALESPSKILFPRDADVPIPNAQKGRLPPKEKPITRSQKSKFLYLRSQDSPQIFLLRCPDCHQSAFTNLQGLYNHSRISHSKEWGSHEELAKACAVPQEELDYELDLDAGVDAGGRGTLLPGVRSLFQMAVEGTRDQSPSRVSNQGEQQSVHLTKTLGLHGDSPALAQFLGKEVKRKEIKVWNDENFIDIYSLPLPPMSRWKKPPPVRTRPTREAEVVTSEKSLQATANDSSRNASNATATSRFHISCRITLTDSSLFIPEGQRLKSKKEHTHQWMISVESASYSLDLTTVLASLTVSPISSFEFEQSMSSSPLVATEPPFVVVGTTAEPFQAQVELLFNSSTSGPGQNGQKVILDHWIGLDMIGTNKLPTKGDEQVVDIELDKDTVIKPAKSGYTPVNAKSHWEHVSNVALGRALKFKQGELSVDTAIPGSYTELLESLVTKFPMTQKGAS
ncbi:hypothetical protein BDP27DRAFT_1296830 [Rhodocollybia butyracea]|uniref:YEATS domain-containing protein n=1 Tax=Rhodocollybia butyracea TaxID=206335 RepID=A0A9P5U5C2_9AGAR|nr:hypothetical protein BDP27DRAFT_1296830 [Rhodocollybia butyracea]